MPEVTILPTSAAITRREDGPTAGSATTKEGEPDLRIIAMPWWQLVGVRALRTYLQSLVGFILVSTTGVAGAVGLTLPVGDFGKLLLLAGSLAAAPAILSLIQNSIELLAKLDVNNPQLRA